MHAKRTLLAAMILITVAGCDVNFGIKGSGNIQTESRDVEAFHAVALSGIGDVNISFGETQSVSITTDDNLLPIIETTVEDGELRIRSKESINPSKSLQVEIVTTSLDAASVSGTGDINIVDARGEHLKLRISGTGDIQANGQVQNLNVTVSGVGDAEIKDLKAENVTVRVSGTGDAEVFASKSLDARVSGVGDITCYGNPSDVKQKASGIGDIEIKK